MTRNPVRWFRDVVASRHDQMSRADEARWAQARSLYDIGELTAQWLEGRIASQPRYCGPVDVDEDKAPGLTDTLARLNRAGFVTDGSQAGFAGPGYDGAQWKLRAAVTGFATAETVAWLIAALTGTRMRVERCHVDAHWNVVPVTRREGVTFTDFGRAASEEDLRDDWVGYGICPPDAVAEILAAWQIVVYDPEWGSNDLWQLLHAAASGRVPRRSPPRLGGCRA